ncbi:U3 small nucleolar RNA-associated protein 14 [Pleurostoma richardsiae]|uniref:U3 small nucleolar RNA-associated protein 14 n=1 Tax=Pleurostoma richardsiae TaxID=41990 RepID=A0AA38S895_9PEZI|nr:U3 small nucleolar RNA-associated protein 14 [Pleurostoma richardsiae]
MPRRQSSGRQSGGRAQPTAQSQKKPNKKTTARSRATALDAFAIAAKQVKPDRRVLAHGRDRDLDPEPASGHRKHRRDEDEDEDGDDGSDSDAAPRKKQRAAFDDDDEGAGSDDDVASDSEGHEWRVGVDEDDDSEIDSDEAFDEEDEERFEGFTFRGSSSKGDRREKGDLSEDDDESEGDDDDNDSLGSDAIDLATALDQYSDDESSAADDESGSGSEEEEESASESPDEDEDEDEEDPSKLGALQSLIKGYAGAEDDDSGAADGTAQSKSKISLKDLGLFGVKDPHMKKSLKLLNKEEKATKSGSTKKLEVPLAKRQQDRLLRAAAYEKTSETLNRWTETVKHNRRADHLIFPLANTLPNAGLDNGELLPLTRKTAASELEQTIMSIMEESGLGPSSREKEEQAEREAAAAAAGAAPSISRAELQELWAQRRRDRELQSREQARAKRIKKIKSKTYRRVHRKEQLRDEQAAEEAMAAEGGGPDSEEEREALHRQRAMERVGARHRESKWARRAAKVGRAAWDDDFRGGLTDMARRDEELRRRVEGKNAGSGDEDDDNDDDEGADGFDEEEEDDRDRLLRKLDELEGDDDGPRQSGLMGMKFMQRAEEARKRENDELVAQMRRELLSDAEEEDEDAEIAEVGRRTYGVPKAKSQTRSEDLQKAADGPSEGRAQNSKFVKASSASSLSLSAPTVDTQPSASGSAGAWSRAGTSERRKDKKHASASAAAELDLNSAILIAKPAKSSKSKNQPKARRAAAAAAAAGGDQQQPASEASGSDSEADLHLPLALRDHELVARAFAGEDVVGEFEAEKAAAASEDDEKVVDNTLPGWGSWVGEGVSERDRRRHQGRFLTKKQGVRKADRKDAKLERVVITEKKVKKNDKYLATQLPHPFESREQYERSLRLPLGPEWMTKESFQDATKPRVIVKQGVIAPMLKPVL